jgi:uncharacterized protein (UPF0216 family)
VKETSFISPRPPEETNHLDPIMPGRPSAGDESTLMRWMRLEIGRINDGVVAERKRLSLLLREEHPSAVTQGGSIHEFDRDVLLQLKEALPRELQRRLRLPIIFYFDSRVPDSLFLTDEVAMQALQRMQEISPLRRMRGGRLWIAKPLAYTIMGRYPTAVQIMMG